MYPDDSEELDADNEDDAYDPDDPETYPPGVYAEDDFPTVPCPYCRKEIAEDVAACPYCGRYISAEDSPRKPRSSFWVIMVLLALAAVALMAFAG